MHMKKWLMIPGLVLLLCGCANNALHDSFSAYGNKTVSELYHESKSNIQDGHYNRAAKELEAMSALYPFGVYAEEGLINLVYAYYKNDDGNEALAAADRYLALYPYGKYADYAYYMKGVIAFKQGFSWLQRKAGINPAPRDLSNFKSAYLSFSQLVQQFPSSPYVPDSVARMRYIRNLFAEKEVGIARFYYDQKAYVAAANRASIVVEHYDRSPWVIPALAIMVRSYQKLHLTNMANNTLRIFQASYPNSVSPKLALSPMLK